MNIRQTLEKIETLLGATVGVVKMVEMTPTEFVAHATAEVTKAMAEKGPESTRRLKSLLQAVTVFKDNYVDGESESVKVPLTFDETTALKEKQNQLIDPLKAGGASQDQSAFAQGFVTKIASIKGLVDSLKAGTMPADGEETEHLDETKAKKGEDEETEKAKGKPFPGAAKPFGKPADEDEEKAKAKKVGENEDEDDDATGATAAEPPEGAPEGEEKGKTKKSVQKGIDKSADGTVWPTDLNDPAFVKDGKVEKSLDWGND